ncbi:RNA polymerase subunit sigma [Rhizobium rhizosphaerae]|uniref:RNA polymerase subunit sigma n=1 Tax=Xaviernesmea rhizosphaerae TaxID=1672749 RepID=A0ABX3P8D3_9HYPH|nr:sigma-70 family RNA polymerase sigma factor [Xaviernesmea rhizosphaerae]OQP83663.1 RNA polymerase subunit sigma [Xaviernesmea rhizosphaerae]
MVSRDREAQWAEWMRAGIRGDSQAYHRFLADVTPYLRAAARRGCARAGVPVSEAEDVVQDVLIALHLKRGSWDPARPLGPWLQVILRHKLIDAFRRRGRTASVAIDEFAELIAAPQDETSDDRRDAMRLLRQLKEGQQEIVRSISLEGQDVRETAQRLNMTEGAVRVALHRALKTLARLYHGGQNENG